MQKCLMIKYSQFKLNILTYKIMKIIAIANLIPAKNKNGAQLVSYQRLNRMSELGYSIDLVCFKSKNQKDDHKAKQILEKKGIHVHFISINIYEAFFNLLKAFIINGLPLQCALFKSKKFTKKIKDILRIKKIEAIYCVMIRVTPNISWYKGKLLIEMIDSMGLNFLRRYKTAKGLKKWIFKKEQEKVSIYEKKLADKSHCSFVVSDIDRKHINSLKIKVIPLGVNVSNKNRKVRIKPVIIFTGNMYYQPNIDAVTWFTKNCWPKILQEEQQAKFFIVGNNPSTSILSISKKYSSIKVMGNVPSIIDKLNKATVAIAPMQSGSGMQIKILEAMSCAIPVVTSNIGLGDLKAVPGKDLLIAKTADDFSKKVISLIQSRKYNELIGSKGQKYILQNHNWDYHNQKFISFIEN